MYACSIKILTFFNINTRNFKLFSFAYLSCDIVTKDIENFRPSGLLAPKTFKNYLVFQTFDFERTWWRLFQKRVVRTKYDIYVYIKFSSTSICRYTSLVYWLFVVDRVGDRHRKWRHRKWQEMTSPEVMNRKWKWDKISRAFPPYFPRFFLTRFLSRFFRNLSRFYVRTMELWIQPVSGHYSAITLYVKPFFESMTNYGSYRNTCRNR